MRAYLIKGLSGTGKSAVCAELRVRGYTAYEADDAFGYYADPVTGEPTADHSPLHWMWDPTKVEAALSRTDVDFLFVCGGSMNDRDFAHRFTNVFTLLVDDATLRERLAQRPAGSMGRKPEELALLLSWNAGMAARAKEQGTILVDASRPVAEVAEEILRYTRRIP